MAIRAEIVVDGALVKEPKEFKREPQVGDAIELKQSQFVVVDKVIHSLARGKMRLICSEDKKLAAEAEKVEKAAEKEQAPVAEKATAQQPATESAGPPRRRGGMEST